MEPILLVKATKARKGWRVTADKYGYTLEEGVRVTDRETKKEKLVWRNRAYYGTIASSLKGFQEIFLRETRRKLPDAIEESMKIIRPVLREINESLTVTI
jgi:hypothetical protein